jgi:hypothetical protein
MREIFELKKEDFQQCFAHSLRISRQMIAEKLEEEEDE